MLYAIERQNDGKGKWEALAGQVFPTVAEAKAALYEAQTSENGKGDGDEYRMVDVGRDGDVYRDALAFGVNQSPIPGAVMGSEHDTIDARGYWTAWFAGRQTAKALLQEARRVGVTADQLAALQAVAADVAYD